MDEKACVSKTTLVEQVPLLWWQTVWEKSSRGLTSPDSVSEKINQAGQSLLIKRQVVWWNYTEKRNGVKICNRSLKKETTPIYGNRCSFDQKRKSCLFKAGMNQLKSYKSSNLLLCSFIL